MCKVSKLEWALAVHLPAPPGLAQEGTHPVATVPDGHCTVHSCPKELEFVLLWLLLSKPLTAPWVKILCECYPLNLKLQGWADNIFPYNICSLGRMWKTACRHGSINTSVPLFLALIYTHALQNTGLIASFTSALNPFGACNVKHVPFLTRQLPTSTIVFAYNSIICCSAARLFFTMIISM